MRAQATSSAWIVVAWLAVSIAPPRVRSSEPESRFEAVGSGRCSAAACHGSATAVSGSRILRNEYTTWANRDPHARAYQVLHSSWSRSIAANLATGDAELVEAHRDGRCLACHAMPGPAANPVIAAVIRQDGVGCESCHGPAGSWLAVHTTYEWDALPPRDKERFGMVSTGDLVRRAAACARCHVGEAGRDVDHDLIAAGHPRQSFEFAAHLANMPAHWVEKDRNAAADFPARAWAIGQAVTARSALELLHARATTAAAVGEQGPLRWPEFAEYDCASCHRALRPQLPSATGGARTGSGLPAWGSWAFPMTGRLAELSNDPGATEFRSSLDRLRVAIGDAAPAPGPVAGEAAAAAQALSRWLGSLERESFEPARVESLIRTIRSPGPVRAPSFDIDAQEYLALVPLRQALPIVERDRGGLLAEIQSRRSKLQLPFVAEPRGAFGSPR